MSAARDGDIAEVENVLKASPKTAKYCSFGVRISPLHFAAAKGHREVSLSLRAVRCASDMAVNLTPVILRFQIVQLLLQHGANPNMRNYTGQVI